MNHTNCNAGLKPSIICGSVNSRGLIELSQPDRRRIPIAQIVTVICWGFFLTSCVATQKYDASLLELQNERKKHQATLSELQAERKQVEQERVELVRQREREQIIRDLYNKAVQKLSTIEMVSRAELLSRLEAKEIEIIDKQEKAYYNGMIDLLYNMQVVGIPSSRGGFLNKTYYYTFEVRLHDRMVYSVSVETKREDQRRIHILSSAADLVTLVTLFPK